MIGLALANIEDTSIQLDETERSLEGQCLKKLTLSFGYKYSKTVI